MNMRMLKNGVLLLFLALTLILNNYAVARSAPTAYETEMVAANGDAPDIEMADQLRRDGKIYIVVGCVLVVLAGMFIYLVSIDRKVGRLEKQFKS
jgi:uncharacterized membrane protein